MRVESEAQMLQFGRDFAGKLVPGDIVAIDGPLGAGKTVFCKGVLAGLGFDGDVTSPTYTIVHQYDPPDVRLALAHVDLYRIENPQDVDELGLFEGDAITLVEWAEQYPPLSAMAHYHLRITPGGETAREIEMHSMRN
jgi:tRNA threonylcarbamoyladenosine biosynthesis protein TsaE